MPRAIAQRSTLPRSQEHQGSSYHGPPPRDIGTSRLPARSNFTQNDSLPGLTRTTSSGPSQSVSDGMGERQMNRAMRIMIPNPDLDGALEPTTLPPFRRPDQDPVLECPFTFIKCFRQFAITNEREWIEHSLEHFRIDGRRPRRVDPPKINSCCFCTETFRASSGAVSWRDRMGHIKVHHHLGHRLAAARHDFALVEYLWQNNLLSREDYRELKPRSMQNIPTPPDSPPGTGAVAVINRNQRHDGR